MKKLDKLADKLKQNCREARQMANDLEFKLGLIAELTNTVTKHANNENNKRAQQLIDLIAQNIRNAHALTRELTDG